MMVHRCRRSHIRVRYPVRGPSGAQIHENVPPHHDRGHGHAAKRRCGPPRTDTQCIGATDPTKNARMLHPSLRRAEAQRKTNDHVEYVAQNIWQAIQHRDFVHQPSISAPSICGEEARYSPTDYLRRELIPQFQGHWVQGLRTRLERLPAAEQESNRSIFTMRAHWTRLHSIQVWGG